MEYVYVAFVASVIRMFEVLRVMLVFPAAILLPMSVAFDVVYARRIRAARFAELALSTAETMTMPFFNVPIVVTPPETVTLLFDEPYPADA